MPRHYDPGLPRRALVEIQLRNLEELLDTKEEGFCMAPNGSWFGGASLDRSCDGGVRDDLEVLRELVSLELEDLA